MTVAWQKSSTDLTIHAFCGHSCLLHWLIGSTSSAHMIYQLCIEASWLIRMYNQLQVWLQCNRTQITATVMAELSKQAWVFAMYICEYHEFSLELFYHMHILCRYFRFSAMASSLLIFYIGPCRSFGKKKHFSIVDLCIDAK